MSTVGISEGHLIESEDVAIEWKDLIEGLDRDADVGNADVSWRSRCQ